MRGRAERLLGRVIPWGLAARRLVWRVTNPVTIGVRSLVLRDDQVLLVRVHGRSTWDLPGGAVHRGELLATAAEREAQEETGWTVEVERILGVYTNFRIGKSDHVAIFVCKPVHNVPLQLNWEVAEARFWPLAALPPCQDGISRRLTEYHAGAAGLYGAW